MRLIAIFLILVSSFLHAQPFAWTQQNSGITTNLADVYFYNNSHGWACGVNGVILGTTDGGQNWQNLSSNTSEPLSSIYFSNANDGWAAGGSNSALLLYTSNQGQTWTVIGSGINSGPILDVAFLPSGDTGWAITADSIYFSANGGANWVAENYSGVIGTAVNKAIALVNNNYVFVGGRRFQTGIQDSSPEVYKRTQSGNSFVWEPTGINQFANMDRIESIAFTNNLVGVAGGIQGKVYRMNPTLPVVTGPWNVNLDLGGGNNQSIKGLDFANDMKAMFATPHQQGTNSYTLVYHTQDTGATWPITDTIANFLVNSLSYPDRYFAWAVGNNGNIYAGISQQMGFTEETHPKPLVKVYNQANSIVVELLNDEITFGVKLFSIDGKLLQNEHLMSGRTSLAIYQNGIYLLEITLENGEVFREKVLVLRN